MIQVPNTEREFMADGAIAKIQVDWKVFKYPTGADIPVGSIYLSTVKNGDMDYMTESHGGKTYKATDYKFVWHYFLVPVKKQ